AQTGDKIAFTLTWTVPSPQNWHFLDSLHFRLFQNDQTALWLRFLEGPNTFSVYNESSRKFGPEFDAGSSNTLETNMAKVYLENFKVQGSGPTGPSVTLTMTISLKPSAAGQTWNLLLLAYDDDGNVQGFDPAGTLTVTK